MKTIVIDLTVEPIGREELPFGELLLTKLDKDPNNMLLSELLVRTGVTLKAMMSQPEFDTLSKLYIIVDYMSPNVFAMVSMIMGLFTSLGNNPILWFRRGKGNYIDTSQFYIEGIDLAYQYNLNQKGEK